MLQVSSRHWLLSHVLFVTVLIDLACSEYVPGKQFNISTIVSGRVITCDNPQLTEPLTFPRETWSCHNIKVDEFEMPAPSRNHKQNMDLENDLVSICIHLLASHGIEGQFWTAFTVNVASTREKMALARQEQNFAWYNLTDRGAALQTLRCMLT